MLKRDSDFMSILTEAMISNANDRNASRATAEETKEAGRRYLERHEFKLGQLVKYKEGMCTGMHPVEGEAAVIIDMQDGLRSEHESGSNHGYEPSEIRIGFIDTDGILEGVWVDANRFEPYEK